MVRPRFSHLLSGLVLMLMLVSSTPRGVRAAELSPPIPQDASDVHCSTGPNGMVCQYRRALAGGGFTFFDAGDTCPGGFEVLVESFQNQGRYIRFYDSTGELTREIRHIVFTGYLSNAQTGFHIPYEGRFTRTFDSRTQLITFTGQRFRLTLPDGHVLVLDAGLTVYDDTIPGPEIIKAGPGGYVETKQTLCSILG